MRGTGFQDVLLPGGLPPVSACRWGKGPIRTSTIAAMGQFCVRLRVRSSIHEDQVAGHGSVESHCKTRQDSEFGLGKWEAACGELTR